MTQEEERAIIDEMIRIFMEDDDFDIYLRELDARNRKSDCRVILSREWDCKRQLILSYLSYR